MIKRIPLARLRQETILPMMTLYVPPAAGRNPDNRIARWFDEG